ncbi:hypothetical protein D918_06336 [Trichuris suis]|nr:hypothetical protein D918_06336 [Trichuris suis]
MAQRKKFVVEVGFIELYSEKESLPLSCLVHGDRTMLMLYVALQFPENFWAKKTQSADYFGNVASVTLPRGLFNKVPDPLNYMVSHWSQDPDIGMAYSYIKVGADGEDYDIVAEDLAKRASNRQFPQTFTGALVSGLREVYKILG